MDYRKDYFRDYVLALMKEMYIRKINFKQKYADEFCIFYENLDNKLESYSLTYPEHNDRYLNQCCFNLQEKYDRGIITEDEYNKIKQVFGKIKVDKTLYL